MLETRHAVELVRGGGGFGYLLKDRVLDVDDFLEAARRVAAGGSALDPEVVATLLDAGVARRQRNRDQRYAGAARRPATLAAMRRTVVEWVVTLAVAALVVLVVEVEVAQPFRVPTSSMEPTLHCARPGIGCTASLNDRVIVAKIVYRFRDPQPLRDRRLPRAGRARSSSAPKAARISSA